MNRNVTALILIVLATGIYFTFTSGRLDELNKIRAVNASYQEAIDNSVRLIAVRDKVLKEYNEISAEDKEKLNKLVPSNVDNVRLIIDVKDDIAARHNIVLKNLKTSSPPALPAGSMNSNDPASRYGAVTLSFSVTSNYQTFVAFLKDLESSLRIMDVTKLSITTTDYSTFDFNVELKTYWLRQ